MMPPRLARRLFATLLPYDHRRVVLSDLDEEFARIVVPSRSAASARFWYWRQVVMSIPGAVRMRGRFQGRAFARDVRHGGRLLFKNPAFALAAVLTLTLGIGATSAVLTVANAVLLRPLPYAEPDRVVSVAEVDLLRDGGSGNVSWPDFIDYKQQNHSLEAMAAYNGGSRTLIHPGRPAERLPSAGVTGQFFDVLGVRPALGRLFSDADTLTGAQPVVVLTDATWRQRYGADPGVLGRAITLSGVSTIIVGVLPAGFEFPPRGLAELWLPLRPTTAQLERKFYHWINAIGRLRPGVTVAQAENDLAAIARGFAASDPRAHANSSARVMRLADAIVGDARPILLVLFAASIFVLLVACANIAGLLMSRNAARSTEMEVRAALGASRWRLVRQLTAEGVALALPGGALGLVCGQLAVRLFVNAIPRGQRASLPHLGELGLDSTAVMISLGLSVGSAIMFSLVPALRAAGHRMALQSTRGNAGGSRRDVRVQSSLVALQVALALVLLFGAGLLTQSLRRLLDVSPGFSADRLLTMTLNLSGERYRVPGAAGVFHAEVLERIAAVPGVTGVATIDQAPLTGAGNSGAFTVRGDPGAPERTVLVRTASLRYFEVIGLPLVEGRTFTTADGPNAPRVVMVNQLAAETLFGGAPIGRQILFPFIDGNPPLEIVGVIGNERFDALDRGMKPVVYFPYEQAPDGAFTLAVRTAGDPSSAVPAIRAAVAAIDDSLPLYNVATMEQVMSLSDAVFRRRSVLVLLAGFAVTAVLLAAVGLFGVLAQTVAQRSREISVRVALGASGGRVVSAVLRPGLAATAVGVAAGLAGCALVGRGLASLLFDTTPMDLTTLVVVTAVLLTAAALAMIVPSRRALRVDPVEALRGD